MRRFLATMLAVFLGGCAAVAGMWSGDRQFPTETISITVAPDTVAAGGQGEVRYVYRRFRICDRRAEISITDASGRTFNFPVQDSPPGRDRVEGKVDTYARPFRVSVAAASGPAIYRVVLQDMCNPIARVWPIERTIEAPFNIGPQAQSMMERGGRFTAVMARLLALR